MYFLLSKSYFRDSNRDSSWWSRFLSMSLFFQLTNLLLELLCSAVWGCRSLLLALSRWGKLGFNVLKLFCLFLVCFMFLVLEWYYWSGENGLLAFLNVALCCVSTLHAWTMTRTNILAQASSSRLGDNSRNSP